MVLKEVLILKDGFKGSVWNVKGMFKTVNRKEVYKSTCRLTKLEVKQM